MARGNFLLHAKNKFSHYFNNQARGLRKFIKSGVAHDAAPAYFDRDYYLRNNPDVVETGADPWMHYLMFGQKEGRSCSPNDALTSMPEQSRPLGPRLSGLNVLVLGTCTIDYLHHHAHLFGFTAKHLLFSSHPYEDLTGIDLSGMDATLVALTLRVLIYDEQHMDAIQQSDLVFPRLKTNADGQELLDRCCARLDNLLVKIHEAVGTKPTFFLSFFLPSFSASGSLIRPSDLTSPACFLGSLNEELKKKIVKFTNFYFVETNEVMNDIGRLYLSDDMVWPGTHLAFVSDAHIDWDQNRFFVPESNLIKYKTSRYMRFYAERFWDLIADNIKIIRQIDPIKLIIVDLDDTLWRGVAAESDCDGVARTEGWPTGFIEALLYYKNRGGLLAVASKNDHQLAMTKLEEIWRGAISAEDFVSVRINWNPKSQNIAEILSEANILAENALFIDDNPREIDEVKTHHPALRCLSGNSFEWRGVILRSPETQVPFITEESQKRTDLVRAKVEREVQSTSMSREDWLRSLRITQKFFILKDPEDKNFQRVIELINKTNQFNTTGKRWQVSEFQDFFQSGGLCLLTSLKDKTADNGIVGIALIKEGEIVQTVLSCRVFGLGAEICMGRIATQIALIQHAEAKASIIDTGKNFSCHQYFANLGFKQKSGYFSTTFPCAAPDWIEMKYDDEVFNLDLPSKLKNSVSAAFAA